MNSLSKGMHGLGVPSLRQLVHGVDAKSTFTLYAR